MRSRPILFSAPMVRAIMSGAKTQTRRVIKPQPPVDLVFIDDPYFNCWMPVPDRVGLIACDRWRCPYGVPGDHLWVRESWARCTKGGKDGEGHWLYRADNEPFGVCHVDGWRWRPSIHMPRHASRITLEITAVRVERLQEISEDDARAEGVWTTDSGLSNVDHYTGVAIFADLWDATYGKRHPWASNPWVWVLEFRRVGT